MKTARMGGTYGSSTVAKALEILNALGEAQRPMSAAELAKKLRLNGSSIYRVLSTLVKYGFVAQPPGTSKYFLGTKLVTLGSVVLSQLDVREISRPVLQDLMRKTGETTHLMMLDGDEGLYIERVESPQTIKMASNVGRREPLHASSVGKAILAHLPEAQVERILGTGPLPKYTENTITDPQELKAHFEQIRKQGYAIDDMEAEEGLRCIGAPIFDHEGKVRYSISISGPAYRISLERLHGFANDLLAGTRAISRALGYQGDWESSEAGRQSGTGASEAGRSQATRSGTA